MTRCPGATAGTAGSFWPARGCLRDERARRRLVAELRTAADNHTWDDTARMAFGAYDDVLGLPAAVTRRLAQDSLLAEAERGEFEGRYWHLRNEIGPTGLTLV